jgi:oxaloacetate decarboxylase alpha subunit
VLGTERYGNVPDQTIMYVLGKFGRPTMPVDPGVLDRIVDRPRARELMAEPPPAPPEELRKKLPRGISEDEFLLRATMPAGEVDAMLAAGPARRRYNPALKPVLDLLGGLAARPPADELLIDKPGFRLALTATEGAPRD